MTLLRRYEPILKFTQGELFFPTSVEPYIERCSLWDKPSRKPSRELVPAGQLNVNVLTEHGSVPSGHLQFMRFVQQPLNQLDFQRWHRQSNRSQFQAPGRLSRVGLPARIIDSMFSLSLLLRGTVPGGTTAAASMHYESIRRQDPKNYYYGRVVHQSGYIVLQYWFFYVMNDWRSTFYGANDHEADWEQVLIYLEDRPEAEPVPIWVAFAAHNHAGDDLRRRWDDPELIREGDHPVVYVGAGSHASYFQAGEYLTSVELEFALPLLNAAHMVERVWREYLRQGDPEKFVERVESILSVPFIDYARGDGLAIGPGYDSPWTPCLLTENLGWLHDYRGLWGLDTQDPFAGERAPAGPKFNRDGTVRQAWYDPLGFAGLNKVAPPIAATSMLSRHITLLQEELKQIDLEAETLRDSLPRLELEVRALNQGYQWHSIYNQRQRELMDGVAHLNALQCRKNQLTETIAACSSYRGGIAQGELGDPQAHIRHKQEPQSEYERQQSAIAEMWSAISVGVLMLGVVALLGFGVTGWIVALISITGILVVVESILYRKIISLLINTTLALAIVTTGILIYEFFWELLVLITVSIAILIITDNIRELRGW